MAKAQVAAATAKNSATIQSPQSINKAAKAREIFAEVPAGTPRKDVLARFESEAQLTPKGAATYYQTMKKEAQATAEKAGHTK